MAKWTLLGVARNLIRLARVPAGTGTVTSISYCVSSHRYVSAMPIPPKSRVDDCGNCCVRDGRDGRRRIAAHDGMSWLLWAMPGQNDATSETRLQRQTRGSSSSVGGGTAFTDVGRFIFFMLLVEICDGERASECEIEMYVRMRMCGPDNVCPSARCSVLSHFCCNATKQPTDEHERSQSLRSYVARGF